MVKESASATFRILVLTVLCTTFIRGEASTASNDEAAPGVKKSDQPVVVLPPMIVKEKAPKLSFGLKLSLWFDGNTKMVTSIYIDKVKRNSDADDLGITPRTKIFSIDGIPVENFVASFNNDTELNRIFIRRKLGDTVTLEIMDVGGFETRTVTLTEKPRFKMKWNTITR